MSDLLWPGDHRAGDLFTDDAIRDAMLRVESAWSRALVEHRVAPADAAVSVDQLSSAAAALDLEELSVDAEAGGNPVIPLVSALRKGLSPIAASWLHRGMTSQDVVDAALVLESRRAFTRIAGELLTQVDVLSDLAEKYRATPQIARTLTQQAVPSTFGMKVAHWLDGVLDAYDEVMGLQFPAQFGGAAGTLSALVELAATQQNPQETALAVTRSAAHSLDLDVASPWHVVRTPFTRFAAAATTAMSSWSHIANDVLTLSRSEIGEVTEGAGGGSSTMPHKANPVLSVLIRRAAITTPALASTLQLASADAVDERTPGGWHAEWATLRNLLRRSVVAASQTTDLVSNLDVHADAMAFNLSAAGTSVLSEQRSMAELAGHEPSGQNVGLAPLLVDATLRRAQELTRTRLAERPR